MRLPLPGTKVGRVLAALMTGKSFNRFQSERELHDHCLHSTISSLQKTYGITISRRTETVPGYQGIPTRCCRYWIDECERKRIKQKAQTTSDQTNGKGFSNYIRKYNAGRIARQDKLDF